jgi:acetyl-CoA carboxylase biotin carboxylase subunit
MSATPPKRILIANRGEIAVRIARSVREMGHLPIAIYSEADANAPHVRLAHEAYCVGPAPSAESYLQLDRLLALAQKHQIDAIHPGYGFMAENQAFAKACGENNIVFIGPKPETIAAMGDKILARQAAAKANVPMVPGTDQVKNAEEAETYAVEIGFPVLLKAKAGGGGKGMRRVTRKEDVREAFDLAQSEARNAFGDDSIYIEKCLVHPRHIEVQVFCDHHGHIYTLGDRECSLQRRHQKIIEEAPAPGLKDETRQAMAAVSKQLCKNVSYRGAGTIEYLVDADENFYFLEMNTRLQVEHPVTEWITGLDLVALQIRAAFGEEIQLDEPIAFLGHSIEVRIYAEDPSNQFFPSPGTLSQLVWPTGKGIRIDSGVEQGSEITLFYDPMIAKISVWDNTRDKAIAKTQQALRELRLGGLTTNTTFLQNILDNPAYQQGQISTTFVEDNMPFEAQTTATTQEWLAAVATALLDEPTTQPKSTPTMAPSQWWNSRLPRFPWS